MKDTFFLCICSWWRGRGDVAARKGGAQGGGGGGGGGSSSRSFRAFIRSRASFFVCILCVYLRIHDMMTVGKCTGMRRTRSVCARAKAPAGKAAVSRRRDARGTVRANAPRLGACGRDEGRRRATVCNASRAKLNVR